MPYPYPQYQPYGAQYAPQGTYLPQNNAQIPPMPTMQNTGSQGLSGASRLVSSREEAVGVPADFAGNFMVFPDITHNRIYTKRWNFQTGAADFVEFAPVVEVEPTPAPAYASADDLKQMQEALAALKEELAKIKKGKTVKKDDDE